MSGEQVAEAVTAEPAPYRFNVCEYYQMADAGIFTEDDRVELIDGDIIAMSPIGAAHAACVNRLNGLLNRHFGRRALISVQNPVRLGTYDEPQPDLAVVKAEAPQTELPGPHDVMLLIEVSDTTLRFDRRTKLPLYARAGIPECWLVDLQGGAIEWHTDPVEGRYRVTVRVERGQQIESVASPGLVLSADDVLG